MSIKVDNLNNLFWDNGSFRFPNTYPHLINGEWLENVTPVMTTPVTGWVVLTGEFNYCEYKGELFFLKKDILISESKNKWRYILIKDHLCSLFKNKANILAHGTLINGSLDKLNDEDFQFTIPVFTNFNKRILLPLNKQVYNWKKHIIPNAPLKNFDFIYAVDNEIYSRFLRQLENNKELLKDVKFEKASDFTLLGRAKLNKKKTNWKNELVKKIKALLSDLNNEEIILSKFPPEFGNSPFLRNKYVITYKTESIGAHIEEHKQVLNLDLSGLKDIELVNLSSGTKTENTYFRVPLKQIPVEESREDIVSTYIKKLSRRNRVSFLNPYSTRAIYERSAKLNTFFFDKLDSELFLPQKVYFKIQQPLVAKSEYQRNFPISRKKESFRSVYLYYCSRLDFVFRYREDAQLNEYKFKEINFIDPDRFLKDDSNKALAKNTLRGSASFKNNNYINPVEAVQAEYESYYPWKTVGENLSIGWLIGQFSIWIDNQEKYFDNATGLVVKSPFSKLKRIKGLNHLVSRIVQSDTAFEPVTIREESNKSFTLDIFNQLPPRLRQATSEVDFLVGEKLLFTTWGLGSYLLFQPLDENKYSYTIDKIDKNNSLFSRWLTGSTWYYGYSLFDEGHYVSNWAKQWFKKAKENFETLKYIRFYENARSYATLKQHIKNNTEAYFQTEEVNFAETPIGTVKVGDIFFSDLEYYFYDYSEAVEPKLEQSKGDWFNHTKDSEAILENGEIVVYHDIQQGGIAIGKVSIWETDTILPENQFISQGSQISSPSSNVNKVTTKLTKISKINNQPYQTLEEVINVLKNSSQLFFSDVTDFTLEELAKTGSYLFDLKGTDFLCYLDNRARPHLIFKEGDRDVQQSSKKIYAIEGTEEISKLEKTQWVNQQINLSIYGQKIELPVKAFARQILITIELDTAELNKEGNALDSHKVEISHALGKTYLRFDTPKLNVVSTGVFNAFEIERADMMNMRASQDYLLKRKEFEMDMESMNIEHRKLKFENKMQKTSMIVDTIMNSLGAVASVASIGFGAATAAGKMASAKISADAAKMIGYGAAIGGAKQGLGAINKVINAPFEWARFNEATNRMNEQIGLSIQKQAVNSYTIDLSRDREKEDYVFSLRRLFSEQSFHQASSRERNLALDDKEADLQGLSRKEDKEIYLELWTISDKQQEYAQEYHKEFGVDCRVANILVPIVNNMNVGVYKLESVEIHNLNDRVDLILLKALLENGIQIVEWVEHEKVKELIPADPRLAKLQELIEESKERIRELEHEKVLLDNRIEELTTEVATVKDEEHRLSEDLKDKKKQLKDTKEELRVVSGQLETEVEKYGKLSVGYRKIESERDEEKKLKNLYLDEKNKLNNELSDCKAREKVLIKEKGNANLKIESLEKDNKQLSEAIKELPQLQEKASQLEELQNTFKERQEAFNELDKQSKECREELTRTKSEVDAQKLQIDKQLEQIKQLESKPTGTLVDTHKNVDYVIAKGEPDKIVVTIWNLEKNIWQEDPDLIVKANSTRKLLRLAKKRETFETSQYLLWSYYRNNWGNEFGTSVSKYSELEGYLTGAPKQTYAWLGRASVKLDNNLPYLNKEGNLAKTYWYHSIKGWFDYDIGEGAREVNSVEEYEAISKNVLVDLKKELQEKENTIKGLRELESAPKEEKELTDNDLKILVKHIFTADVISKTTHLWNTVNLLITKDSQNGLIYLQYEQDVFCWVVTKLKVWAYDGYKAFSISRRTDNKLDQLDNDREYWRTLRSGYFIRNITHWARPQGVNALMDWVYVGNYNVNITENLRWPFFEVKPKSDDDLVRNAKGKIYYHKENREYTYAPTDVPVNNYRDYKQTLRMMFSPN